MKPIVGRGLDGHCYTPRDSLRTGAVGEPIWGPAALLRNLELRLGLPSFETPASMRVQSWAEHIDALLPSRPFYTRSFEVDRIGTTIALLGWRDVLLDAGWDGTAIPAGGERLDALAKLEASRSDAHRRIVGTADRLVRVEHELRTGSRHPIFESLALADDRNAWPARWRSVFSLLESRGTRIAPFPLDLAVAREGTDLELVQRLLHGEHAANRKLTGDGSLLIIRGDTSTDLAELAAAFLTRHAHDAAIVRCAEIAPLETALARHGLPQQGHTRPSAWRPAMQILPLAIELAFEPRDPFRVLELLTLPGGPFRGLLSRLLARAVSRQPGIGGQEWTRQRTRAAELLRERHVATEQARGASPEEAAAYADVEVGKRMTIVAEWLEAPGNDPDGTPRERILAVAERVRTWLQKRNATEQAPLYRAAYGEARALCEALMHDTRAQLTREEVRNILDELARGAAKNELSDEQAGRIPYVAHPSALLGSAATVVAWAAVAGTERRPPMSPWNAEERAALEARGVFLQDSSKILRAEGDAWRRVVLAARERAVFFVPGTVDGQAPSPHPVLDEVLARLGVTDEADVDGKIVFTTRTLLERGGHELASVGTLAPLPLPESRASWKVAPDVLDPDDPTKAAAATSLEKLASCPLAWVLERRAKLRTGAIAKVASGPLLNGNLSHRLVEELFKEGAFGLEESAFMTQVGRQFEALIATEGTTLLLPGARNERDQLTRQIAGAMRALYRYLKRSGLRIAGVEEQVRVVSKSGQLEGRLDVRLADENGDPAVLDLKWGKSSYQAALEEGRAVQLAAYARAIAGEASTRPPAGYFAISAGKELSTDPRMKPETLIDGPSLDETWERVEATAAAVMKMHATGKVVALGTRRSLPLLQALGVPEPAHEKHYTPDIEQACKYCAFDVICGKAWEALS